MENLLATALIKTVGIAKSYSMKNKDIRTYNFFQLLTQLNFVEKIILFGSRARQDNQERSDIDIAIICPQASSSDWHTILNIIDEADTLLSVDCIRFDELQNSNPFKERIIKDGIILYEK